MTNSAMTDWIEWQGGECPVAPETAVFVKLRNGIVHHQAGDAGGYSGEGDGIEGNWWRHDGHWFDIIAYRIVSPAPTAPAQDVEGLLRQADITAKMLRMGEPIAFGSDAAIIEELATTLASQAAEIERLTRERDEGETAALEIGAMGRAWKVRAETAEATITELRAELAGERAKVIEEAVRELEAALMAAMSVIAAGYGNAGTAERVTAYQNAIMRIRALGRAGE